MNRDVGETLSLESSHKTAGHQGVRCRESYSEKMGGGVVVVKAVESSSSATEVFTTDGRKLLLRPFLYLRPYETLEFIPSVEDYKEINKIVRLGTESEEIVKIHPPYERTEFVEVSPHVFKVTFRERRSTRDWNTARFLEQFHYRGKGLNRLVGRRTVLLADSENHGIVGYGVVASTVGAARPRFKLFQTNFKEQLRSKLINEIVRIPRIVIHPEFRGMGLGVLMAKHLCQYVDQYWDVRGYRPVVVEVIAAMTDYHKFFETAGFMKLGYTGGYDEGIFPLYGRGGFEQRNSDRYDFFASSKPKPYLVFPLRDRVQKLIQEQFPIPKSSAQKGLLARTVELKRIICFQNVWVRYRASDGMTHRAHEVMESFGVDRTQMFSTVLRKFSLTIHPGDIVLITGASGSGKSTVVKLLAREAKSVRSFMRMRGILRGHDVRRVAVLTTQLKNRWPLIDQVGSDIGEAIGLLNGVGLAEAHLYLKRPRQISEGQKYRFAVAKLCHTQRPVWIADEFASTLDPETSAILAKGLRKISYKFGATLVLAAAHIDGFVRSLLPNTIVELRWGEIAKVHSVKLRHGVNGDKSYFWIHNRGQNDLNKVELGGINVTGKLMPFVSYSSLAARQRTQRIEVDSANLKDFTAVAVRASEGVGDVLYLTWKQRL